MDWKRGYYANSGYTYGFHPETMPFRLHWASLIQGHITPTKSFRYLDAGCGQGLNIILAAAAHPDSEFIGLDFMPNHISHARNLASRCGLDNVTFIEADFCELLHDPSALKSLGEFDYAVCHGVSTWVSPHVKNALYKLVSKALKPGGIFYNSYNTHPGWLSVVPFQHLVQLEQERLCGVDAVASASKTIEILSQESGFLSVFPGMKSRLESFKNHDPAYLVQEYNNQFWQPVFVSQMLDDMAAVKLDYMGTSTLAEVFSEDLPKPLRELIANQPTEKLKLQVRDYGVTQSFRRDLYVKGKVPAWLGDINDLMASIKFVSNDIVPKPKLGEPYRFASGTMVVDGQASIYSAVHNQLSVQGGMSLCDVRVPGHIVSLNNIAKIVSLLMHGGWVLPILDLDLASSNINRGISDAVCSGAPYKFLSVASASFGVTLNELEIMIINAHLNNIPEVEWTSYVLQKLGALGRSLIKDGKILSDSRLIEAHVKAKIHEIKPKISWLSSLNAI